jgi:hypothetical protein
MQSSRFRSFATPSVSSAASRNTDGGIRPQAEYERPRLHQYVEALRREGPYAFGEKPTNRNASLLLNLDSILTKLQ